ncbi:succinate dehydrogenase assembly factor 2 [Rickettsiella endosymbiont of Miltochrista miniata]|uniref:FAD assembly factor SdhE n=1 Tax=Rickettsiella endosymbiont of Miltochrista miniata TaxID=3066239 RepID=UPI00313C9271
MKNLQEKLQRLRWQCRRGMLELDLILLAFLDKNYLNLKADDQVLFEQLLTYSDQDLYCHMIKRQPIENEAMRTLIERMISCGC